MPEKEISIYLASFMQGDSIFVKPYYGAELLQSGINNLSKQEGIKYCGLLEVKLSDKSIFEIQSTKRKSGEPKLKKYLVLLQDGFIRFYQTPIEAIQDWASVGTSLKEIIEVTASKNGILTGEKISYNDLIKKWGGEERVYKLQEIAREGRE